MTENSTVKIRNILHVAMTLPSPQKRKLADLHAGKGPIPIEDMEMFSLKKPNPIIRQQPKRLRSSNRKRKRHTVKKRRRRH
jgi:hypothetical protein